MTYLVPRIIPQPAELTPEPKGGFQLKRVVLWFFLVLCSLMIAVILLSQPKVVAQMQIKAEYLSGRFNGEITEPAPVLNFSPDGESSSSSARSSASYRMFEKARGFMPKDIVPVRRSGILAGK